MRRLRVGDTVQIRAVDPPMFGSQLEPGDVGVVMEVLRTWGSTTVKVRFWREPSYPKLVNNNLLDLVSNP